MATTNESHDTQDSIPFFPDHVRTEAWVSFGVLVVLIIVGILGTFSPVGLQAPADPMDTPAHVKPEWYFLFLYQILKFVPKTLGVLIPIVGVLVLMLWPFIDRKPDTSRRASLIRLIAAAVLLAVIVALTIWGEVS